MKQTNHQENNVKCATEDLKTTLPRSLTQCFDEEPPVQVSDAVPKALKVPEKHRVRAVGLKASMPVVGGEGDQSVKWYNVLVTQEDTNTFFPNNQKWIDYPLPNRAKSGYLHFLWLPNCN